MLGRKDDILNLVTGIMHIQLKPKKKKVVECMSELSNERVRSYRVYPSIKV